MDIFYLAMHQFKSYNYFSVFVTIVFWKYSEVHWIWHFPWFHPYWLFLWLFNNCSGSHSTILSKSCQIFAFWRGIIFSTSFVKLSFVNHLFVGNNFLWQTTFLLWKQSYTCCLTALSSLPQSYNFFRKISYILEYIFTPPSARFGLKIFDHTKCKYLDIELISLQFQL